MLSSNAKPQLIAMVHVHSSNALLNTSYNKYFNQGTYSSVELGELIEIRKELYRLSEKVCEESGSSIFNNCRNASFLLKKNELHGLEQQVMRISFVQTLINRALKEVGIYCRNGIKNIEVENVGAPYFIGNEIPLEELLILHVVAQSIKNNFPKINIGIQVLSCGELEALPIAIACGAFFVRSEASVFKGLRPEGETSNQGNLAKFYYLRNYLNTLIGLDDPENRRSPALWCDLQKKHTVFNQELHDLNSWLSSLLFQKMEGIVLTGAETGSDIAEADLIQARKSIQQTNDKIAALSGLKEINNIPLVTGSGANIEMYSKYADYIITGTSLKKNNYWENEVDETLVKSMVERFSR